MSASVGRELRVTSATALVLLLVVGAMGLLGVSLVAGDISRAVTRVAPALHLNAEMRHAAAVAESSARGYGLSGSEQSRTDFVDAVRRANELESRLRTVLSQDQRGRRLLARESAALQSWIQTYAQPRFAAEPGSFDAELFAAGEREIATFEQRSMALDDHLHDRLESLRSRATLVRNVAVAVVVGATLLAVLGSELAYRAARRRVVTPLYGLVGVLGRLRQGDHAARAEVTGPREVAEIARSVNDLAEGSDRLRRMEAEERRLQRRLLAFSREIRSSMDPDAMLRAGTAELGRTLDVDRVWLRTVVDGAAAGIGAEWHAEDVGPLPAQAHQQTPGAEEELRALLAQNAARVTPDVATDPLYATDQGRSWARIVGAGAAMAVPVVVHGEPMGVVSVVDRRPRAWKPAEVHLAESVAADLGRAIADASTYAAQIEASERLRRLDRAKDEFLSSISHELRTPLTSINGYVELLEDDDDLQPRHRQVLAVVRRNVDRLRNLIEDLLTLSRIESGAFRSARVRVDLRDVVDCIVEDLAVPAEQAGLRLVRETPDFAVPVQGDEAQLERALLNLVANAIKFTPDGGRVSVSLSTRDEQAVLEVADTGMGIPEHELGQLFSRFYRASNAVDAGVPGTGLGLVLVGTIAENHSGTLTVESEQGVGTTVRLALPLATGGNKPAPEAVDT